MSDVGEIQAVLKIDASQWFAELERAKVEAESLKEVDPKIRVTTDGVGRATAELEGVKLAADRAGTSADLFGQKAADAGRKATDAAKGPIPWIGILVGSIAAVSPGIVAVGAAAIGLSGSLVGLGAAGVLAFKGIQDEMAAGTSLGQQYTAMFAGLQSDLSSLERTGAVGIFTGLSAAVQTVEGDMRPLTADVALLSGQLGGLLATGADTAVHALNGFTPALVAGGAALQAFLQGVDGFTQSNGFTAFIGYTVSRLPDVMHLIDATLGAVGSIFTALAPAGQSTLFLLSSLVNLVQALAPTLGAVMPLVVGLSDAIGGVALVVANLLNALGPIGPGIVGTGAAVWGLTAASRALSPALLAAADAEGVAALATRALGAAIDFMLGPIGLAILAAGLIASAVMAVAANSSQAATGIGAYKNALETAKGSTDQALQSTAAYRLQHQGLTADLQKVGVTQQEYTKAIADGGNAYKDVEAKLRGETGALAGNAGALSHNMQARLDLLTNMQKEHAGVLQAIDAYNKEAKAAGLSTIKTGEQLQARRNLAASYGMTLDAFTQATAAEKKQADAADQARNKMILEGDAAALLKLDLDKLNGANISNAEAQAAWASGLDALKSQFNSTSKAITGNSRAAVENRGAIAGLVATGQTALESYAQQTHSVSQTTAEYKSMRSELINQISAITGNRTAARQLVDEYFKIPKSIKTDFTGNDADAKAKAAAAKKAAEDFARGDYKAAYKADPTPANKAKADAMAKAEAFAHAHYEATYKADPALAKAAAEDAARKARSFASGYYNAYLRAHTNAPAVAAAARAALNSVQSREVYLTVYESVAGNTNAAQIAKNASLYGATGGTATRHGMQYPGMADGGTPYFAGSVSGPGTSWNDMAGLFRLADREFVTSNRYGQADAFRGVLEAINNQTVRTPAQLAQLLGAPEKGKTTVIHRTFAPQITVVNPVAVDPVTQVREAAQHTLAYSAIV